ncbi:MAG: type II secretion system protein [Peptococcaceae bacterium]|nr:type II secretion system protein [Peptococcaceae bacterium]
MSQARIRTEAGLTLLEMVIVMLIMGVLLAVAVPSITKTTARANLDTITRQLMADIREARERTMAEKQTYFVRFYPDVEKYKVFKAGGSDRWVEFPAHIDLTSTNFPNHEMYFNVITGAPSRGGYVTICNTQTSEYRYVIVTPVTGRVRIDNTPPEEQ